MASKFQFRRDTTANWSAANPVLSQGEVGLDTTLNIFKIGNGVTAWNSLSVASSSPTTTESLSNKTLVSPTLDGTVKEDVYALTGTDIAPANGSIQYKTLTTNTTLTNSLQDGQSVTLMLNPSTFATTWFTTTWIGSKASTAPILVASVYNCITFFKFGGVVYGKYEGRV